ncbi:MAG: hypothetical protein MUP14_04325 [Dehalococcoidia bacterium]|nr:hypothetical protein [Dehalococcoidia bacterium]
MAKRSPPATIRPLRPADLMFLAPLWAMGKALFGPRYHNEAQTWERLGLEEPRVRLLGSALRQWLPLGGRRHTWTAVRGVGACALASARRRCGPSAWEVDYLVTSQGNETVCWTLLEQLSEELGRAGVEKLFLRLEADSPLLEMIRQAGFFPYLKERLLAIAKPPQGLESWKLPLRERTSADAFALFQLYNAAVPAAVRRNEAATVREWVGVQEKGHCQHLITTGAEGPVAWLRIAKSNRVGRFSLLTQRREEVPLDYLLAAALDHLADRRPILCLVPEYQKAVAHRLEELGFRAVAEYVVLVNRLARPAEEAVPVAEGVRHPYPVS